MIRRKFRINERTIFFDVDTQKDFMNKDGDLYVPEAESLKDSIEALTWHTPDYGIQILGSLDAHTKKDPEFIEQGGPFPPHCIKRTEGYKKIPESYIGGTKPIRIENKTYDKQDYLDLFTEYDVFHEERNIGVRDRAIYFEKQTYDVFTNPNIRNILREIDPKQAIVYGVATEYCVKAAAIGLKDYGVEHVYVIRDAIKPITKEGNKEAINEMVGKGIKFASTNDVITFGFYRI